MPIGHTSSRCARRRMLSPSKPSSSTSSSATPRMRSRERRCCLLPGMYYVLYTVHRTGTGEVAVRRWVWIALTGQAVFIASWVVAGALEPGYSHAEQAVSELGAKDAAHAWIVNAGLVVYGLSFVALGLVLARVLRSR